MSAEYENDQDEASQPLQILRAADVASDLELATLLLPPFAQGPALHRHPARHEICYVLEGVLAARRADEVTVLHAGELLDTPPGVEHTYWNPTATPTRLLLIYGPGAAADVLHRLAHGDVQSAGGTWDTS